MIENIDINLIKTDGQNPNEMNDLTFTALKQNITKYGFLFPVVTNSEYVIADGEHRYKAAKDLGFKEIPVYKLDIKDVDRRILRQVLNKLKGRHNEDLDKPSNSELHPTTKPIELCSKAIDNSSKSNDIVLDLFGGSGSTLIACENLNRKCFMMELDEKYCQVIINRWENLTGKKAEKIN